MNYQNPALKKTAALYTSFLKKRKFKNLDLVRKTSSENLDLVHEIYQHASSEQKIEVINVIEKEFWDKTIRDDVTFDISAKIFIIPRFFG